MAEAQRYTLDTSAIIAYFTDEAGAEEVQRVLMLAASRKAEIYVSFITFMELLYRIWRQRGERQGKVAYLRLKALGLRRIDVSESLLLRAARIKAEHDLSLADAWIAATALLTGSRLVHKDPEFRQLQGSVELFELPLKRKLS